MRSRNTRTGTGIFMMGFFAGFIASGNWKENILSVVHQHSLNQSLPFALGIGLVAAFLMGKLKGKTAELADTFVLGLVPISCFVLAWTDFYTRHSYMMTELFAATAFVWLVATLLLRRDELHRSFDEDHLFRQHPYHGD